MIEFFLLFIVIVAVILVAQRVNDVKRNELLQKTLNRSADTDHHRLN